MAKVCECNVIALICDEYKNDFRYLPCISMLHCCQWAWLLDCKIRDDFVVFIFVVYLSVLHADKNEFCIWARLPRAKHLFLQSLLRILRAVFNFSARFTFSNWNLPHPHLFLQPFPSRFWLVFRFGLANHSTDDCGRHCGPVISVGSWPKCSFPDQSGSGKSIWNSLRQRERTRIFYILFSAALQS